VVGRAEPVPRAAVDGLDGLAAAGPAPEGNVTDQTELHAVLERLRNLGVELVSINAA
jgi:hypothetical protein